jgi:hypothetical protein
MGNNVLVLLSPVGFDDGVCIKDVDSVTLFIYTDKMDGVANLQDIKLIDFKNTAELQEYFSETRPLFYSEYGWL